MKVLVIILFLLFCCTSKIYSQPENITKNNNRLNEERNNIPFINGSEDIPGPQCSGGIIYDDNTMDNAYGSITGTGICKYVMKIKPPVYPYTITQLCFALTRLPAGSANWTFDIEVWDTTGTGGSPGNLVKSIPNQTAVGVSVWPNFSWHDFTGLTSIPPITSGSYYVGISWNLAIMGNHYIGADQSTTTILRTGYTYSQSVWSNILNNFPEYKALGIRADGISQLYTHDIGTGPFLGFPASFTVGTQNTLKAKITNFGLSNETGIPIKFLVNNTELAGTTLNLVSSLMDSVSFNWTPPDTGDFIIKIVSSLSNDQNRANDTTVIIAKVFSSGAYYTCVGTDTLLTEHPFATHYKDVKSQMLYTSSEIINGGGIIGLINKIGFKFNSVDTITINGFTIKMMNTNASILTGVVISGLTMVYTGNYIPPGTGWQFITLNTPFAWNGQNLLIEICFDNSIFSLSSFVKGSNAPNMSSISITSIGIGGCLIDNPTTLKYTRPNICMVINNWVGNKTQETEIPKEYSLSQNYPNPFNPKTIINYQLPANSDVKLIICDVLGREVIKLIDTRQNAGVYNVEWDASNYPSGLYLYKLQCGNFTDTKKMVLIK